ncbi:hypothetical protein OBBRIDRAFT_720305 [Obba rivulosa]|uniref:Cytochrome b561 domain-containing protein n=1 Tax=Obba rivulosa TaxID=1052685 RepID=A0A8E2DTS6_9APHY|nr:hypothetical protein OBBRIDRAFT_720305 [Obba rivulosa]
MLPKSLLQCLTLSLSSQFISEVSAFQGDSWCGNFMCVDASVDQSTVTYTLRSLNQLGWMAIGFGTRMQNTPMVILWPNTNGSVTLSQRQATGEVEPLPVASPPRRARLVLQNYVRLPADVVPTLAFDIAKNDDTVQQLIWAFGITPPDPDASANIEQHLDAGQFSLNLTKTLVDDKTTSLPSLSSAAFPTSVPTPSPVVSDPSSPPESDHGFRNSSLLKAHAVLSGIGFLVFLPMAALVARWSRTVNTKWVNLHWFIVLTLVLPFATIGWVLGPLAVAQRRSAHMANLHQICGVIIFPVLLLQILLGILISVRPIKDGRTHPPSNVVHVVAGLAILGFSVLEACCILFPQQVAYSYRVGFHRC